MDSSTVLREALCDFRTALYRCFDRRSDALFEVSDALLTAGPLPSPVHLSMEAVHRRGWGSFYAALARGRIDVDALRALVMRHPLDEERPVYAVDASVWARSDAETSPARGFYYHPSRHSAGQPIVAGWAYQWIAQLGFTRDSWSAPVDVRRLHPSENASLIAAEQIKRLLRDRPAASPAPLFVFDAGYDSVQLAEALAGVEAAILVRLRSGRCFYADPPPYGGNGRPRRHGRKFTCQDPATWPSPSAEHICEDQQYGRVRVRAWTGLHAKTQDHPTRGTRQPRPIQRGTLVLVEVTRLPGRTYRPQVLWLWWQGPGEPDLEQLWRAYVRRFDLEHTFRFLKQTLGWTTPRLRHPEQADRWSWLMLAAYTQLRLARSLVADQRLPWERPIAERPMAPCRVRRAFWSLLIKLGTPANVPKPRGLSPGRPKGRRSGRAPRHPALKKAA